MNDFTDQRAGRRRGRRERSDPRVDRILARIGQLTRTLRDSMRELGLDKHVERRRKPCPMLATV